MDIIILKMMIIHDDDDDDGDGDNDWGRQYVLFL